jgi:hypothetical protein
MNQTTPIDSLFSRQSSGKFLSDEELRQIQQDLTFLMTENKNLAKQLEHFQSPHVQQEEAKRQEETKRQEEAKYQEALLQAQQQEIQRQAQLLVQQAQQQAQLQEAQRQAQLQEAQRQAQLQEAQRQEAQRQEAQRQEEAKRQEALQKADKPVLSILNSSHDLTTSHGEHITVSIDMQLLYMMVFIILVILILKK